MVKYKYKYKIHTYQESGVFKVLVLIARSRYTALFNLCPCSVFSVLRLSSSRRIGIYKLDDLKLFIVAILRLSCVDLENSVSMQDV